MEREDGEGEMRCGEIDTVNRLGECKERLRVKEDGESRQCVCVFGGSACKC